MPRSNQFRETAAPLALLTGDTLVTFGGLSLGWWLRYASPIGRLGINVPDATYRQYLPLLLVGVALLIGAFAQFGLYDTRLLLRRYASLRGIIKGSAIWLAVYLGISLVLKFEPPISRLFVVLSFLCVIVLLHLWRSLTYAFLTRSSLLPLLQRRAILLGWNDDARALAEEVARDRAHPYAVVGVVTSGGDTAAFVETRTPRPPALGTIAELPEILARTDADLLIATRLDMPREQLRQVVETCERAYVEWKVVPAAFDIFLTGLRLQTIGRVPVLGVDELAINRLFNRGLKRTIDIVGACFGLVVSAPLMLVLAALIRRESPGAPAIFRQERVGADHRLFTLYKLRSMRPQAESRDNERQSTARNDERLLRVGGFLRRWNLDELPQFWNVLRGDMSLVGPRPERTHHVEQLAEEIPHYLPRHLVRPGMTGWAQINGLRGEGSLTARIQHDIYYIENWSIWLDIQILLLTFVRWRSPDGY